MIISRSTVAALAGTALAGLLAACGPTSAGDAYVPVTASTPSPTAADPVQAPAQVAPAGSQAPAGQPPTVVVPQAPATDFSALARRFVALRNQGTQALAAIRTQTSNSDLEVDKRLMAQAAAIFGSYGQQLHALPFPVRMRPDADAVVAAVATVQGTFVQASQVASFNDLGPLLQKLTDEQDAQLTATNVVERDLGLPQSTPRP
jgi:hypothetical protein